MKRLPLLSEEDHEEAEAEKETGERLAPVANASSPKANPLSLSAAHFEASEFLTGSRLSFRAFKTGIVEPGKAE